MNSRYIDHCLSTQHYLNRIKRSIYPYIDSFICRFHNIPQLDFDLSAFIEVWLDHFLATAYDIYSRSDQGAVEFPVSLDLSFHYGWLDWMEDQFNSKSNLIPFLTYYLHTRDLTVIRYPSRTLSSSFIIRQSRVTLPKRIIAKIQLLTLKLYPQLTSPLIVARLSRKALILLLLRRRVLCPNDFFERYVSLPLFDSNKRQCVAEEITSFNSEDDFTRRIISILHVFLPTSCLENLVELEQLANTIGPRSSSLSTVSWGNNELYKYWVAKNIYLNTNFTHLIAPHGGGSTFNSFNGIDSKYQTHPELGQVPNLKVFSDDYTRTSVKHNPLSHLYSLPLLAFSTYRRKYDPHPEDSVDRNRYIYGLVTSIKRIHELGYVPIIRPHPQDTDTSTLLISSLSQLSIPYEISTVSSPFLDELARARFLLATYPQTTFAEGLSHGYPTVLYNTSVYFILNPLQKELLMKNSIWNEDLQGLECWLSDLTTFTNPNTTLSRSHAIHQWLLSLHATSQVNAFKWLEDYIFHHRSGKVCPSQL